MGVSFAGQCNDAFFNLSKKGKVSFLLDSAESFTENGILLRSGQNVSADIIIVAAGCKFTKRPKFLEGVKTGRVSYPGTQYQYQKLLQRTSYISLGPSGMIAGS